MKTKWNIPYTTEERKGGRRGKERRTERKGKKDGNLKIYQTVNINIFDKTFALACNKKKQKNKNKSSLIHGQKDREMYLKEQKKKIKIKKEIDCEDEEKFFFWSPIGDKVMTGIMTHGLKKGSVEDRQTDKLHHILFHCCINQSVKMIVSLIIVSKFLHFSIFSQVAK